MKQDATPSAGAKGHARGAFCFGRRGQQNGTVIRPAIPAARCTPGLFEFGEWKNPGNENTKTGHEPGFCGRKNGVGLYGENSQAAFGAFSKYQQHFIF